MSFINIINGKNIVNDLVIDDKTGIARYTDKFGKIIYGQDDFIIFEFETMLKN